MSTYMAAALILFSACLVLEIAGALLCFRFGKETAGIATVGAGFGLNALGWMFWLGAVSGAES